MPFSSIERTSIKKKEKKRQKQKQKQTQNPLPLVVGFDKVVTVVCTDVSVIGKQKTRFCFFYFCFVGICSEIKTYCISFTEGPFKRRIFLLILSVMTSDQDNYFLSTS